MFNEWKRGRRAEQIIYNLRQANLVTTTTDYLANIIGNFNKNVEVLPNGIDFEQPQFKVDDKVRELKSPDMVHIGWSGSITHKQDVELLDTPFYELLHDQDLIDKYRLILSGYVEKDPTWGYYEKVFTSNWKIDVNQYARINAMDTNTYASAYDAMDIGLIPLRHTEFNICKSNLKMLEMGAKGLAVIVSQNPVYENIGLNGKNCIFVDKKDWYKTLKKLINNEELRIELATNLYNDVKDNWNIEKLNLKRTEVYKNLLK
jgi:glycosyltransferase involved in cell wall biosynthesis